MSRTVATMCDQLNDACAVLESAANRLLSELQETRRKISVFGDGGNSDDQLIDEADLSASQTALTALEGDIRTQLDDVADKIRDAQRDISAY